MCVLICECIYRRIEKKLLLIYYPNTGLFAAAVAVMLLLVSTDCGVFYTRKIQGSKWAPTGFNRTTPWSDVRFPSRFGVFVCICKENENNEKPTRHFHYKAILYVEKYEHYIAKGGIYYYVSCQA